MAAPSAAPPTGASFRERTHALAESVPDALKERLDAIDSAFVLSDPKREDCPIVYVSKRFETLCGWYAEECLGKNCRFMQGPDTDRMEVARIREAVATEQPFSTHLINYTRDGTPFVNSLHIAAVRDASGNAVFYAGIQVDDGCTAERASADWGRRSIERASAEWKRNSAELCRTSSNEHTEFPLRERRAHNGALGRIRVAVRSLHL